MKGYSFELDWYVLTVSPLCEKAVASRIKRLFGGVRVMRDDGTSEVEAPDGVATWVPITKEWVKRQHGRVPVERNLAPRYLFFGHVGPVPWLDVREVMGVHGAICVGGAPARLKAEVVGELISRVERGAFAMREAPVVQRGMRVVGERGMYKGLEGDVVTIDKERGVAGVLFDSLFAGTMPVEMNLDDVVSVAYASHRMSG